MKCLYIFVSPATTMLLMKSFTSNNLHILPPFSITFLYCLIITSNFINTNPNFQLILFLGITTAGSSFEALLLRLLFTCNRSGQEQKLFYLWSAVYLEFSQFITSDKSPFQASFPYPNLLDITSISHLLTITKKVTWVSSTTSKAPLG